MHKQSDRSAMKSLRFAIVVFCAVAAATLSLAQTNQANITGVVTDSTGAVVTRAQVTVLNTETGVPRVLRTK
jgi:hypothetical protein